MLYLLSLIIISYIKRFVKKFLTKKRTPKSVAHRSKAFLSLFSFFSSTEKGKRKENDSNKINLPIFYLRPSHNYLPHLFYFQFTIFNVIARAKSFLFTSLSCIYCIILFGFCQELISMIARKIDNHRTIAAISKIASV